MLLGFGSSAVECRTSIEIDLLCGPHDPEMAKTVRPKSLRAVFGKDRVKNAVHCTDLP